MMYVYVCRCIITYRFVIVHMEASSKCILSDQQQGRTMTMHGLFLAEIYANAFSFLKRNSQEIWHRAEDNLGRGL